MNPGLPAHPGDPLATAPAALQQPRTAATVLDRITDGVLLLDRAASVTYCNQRARELLGPVTNGLGVVLGAPIADAFPGLRATAFGDAVQRAGRAGEAVEEEIFASTLCSWLLLRAMPFEDGVCVFLQDVTRRKQAELRLAAERRVLEAIAQRVPLAQVLEMIATEAEQQSVDGVLCSILLLDESGERLLHGAAPTLPDAYNAAIHGIRIGPGVGSCGTAAFERRPVWVCDIASDPLWKDFRELAAAHGLCACCSTPMFAADGTVLGTIAMYYRKPWTPSEADAKIIEVAARLAGIAIERQRSEQRLRRSEQFSQRLIDSSRDCIKTLSLDGKLTWISEHGCRDLCIGDPATVIGSSWIDFWQGEYRELARKAVDAALGGDTGSFVGLFPVEGRERWWDVAVSPVPDALGSPERLLAVSRDITERFEAERRARESATQLEQLANVIPQLAWMAEPDGYIFWYNERWYEYTGTTPRQMEGWGWQSVHDPAVLPSVLERWRASIASGEPFEMEFPLKGADGAFRWFLTRVQPMRDANGKVVRWFGTNTDVDQVRRMRQALEEERRVLEVLNRTGAALASTLDLQAVLQKITDAATELSGAQFGAFFYNVVDEGEAYMLYTLCGAPREAFAGLGKPRATALFGPTFRGEGIIRCDDVRKDPRYGQWAPHHGMPAGHLPVRSYLAVPVTSRSGEVVGGLFFGHEKTGVFTDRSERLVAGIAAHAAIAVDNARLYQDAQRSAEERKFLLDSERSARSTAEHAVKMKDEFLATVSHELRTPLSAILGWTQVLRLKQASEDEMRRGIEAIDRNARAQKTLIEDLLDMSRIAAGKLRIDAHRVELQAVVEAALETVRPVADGKGVRLATERGTAPAVVRGDPARLQQVVWNLLTNAIKFTPAGGTVTVSLRCTADAVSIAVADTGQGIDPEFVKHVFERFRQADSSATRQHGGLGLGLAIVRSLVELHGGSVRADSCGPGTGATFTVTLPLAGDEQPRQAADGHAPTDFRIADLTGRKIVVVDDQPDARELVTRMLTECGASVLTADSAAEALRLVAAGQPDLLVSDIGMPEVDGFTLLSRVRALEGGRFRQLPAVALTAFARPEDRARVIDVGFACHVPKPIEAAELVSAIARVLRESAQR